ncbi:MAG TPA: restriction endonuclease subunit R, partial [Allocoleopsis sp.]
EGVVKAMTIFPLLRLAGFYHPPIRFRIEEGIGEIVIDDEETRITGRFDLVAVDFVQRTCVGTPFWILVVEAKEGSFSPWVGLPQLLTYAYQSLQTQAAVWGLVATGSLYQFVYLEAGLEAGETPVYRLMPLLNLFETAETDRLLQVLKAIRRSEYAA